MSDYKFLPEHQQLETILKKREKTFGLIKTDKGYASFDLLHEFELNVDGLPSIIPSDYKIGKNNDVYVLFNQAIMRKYNHKGEVLWTYTGIENSSTLIRGQKFDIDKDENIVFGSRNDVVILDKDGNVLHAATRTALGLSEFQLSSAFFDKNGDVYTASFGTALSININKIKGDLSELLWSYNSGLGGGVINQMRHVHVDDANDVYFGGRRDDYKCVKFDGETGDKLWESNVGDTALNFVVVGNKIYLANENNNIYVLNQSNADITTPPVIEKTIPTSSNYTFSVGYSVNRLNEGVFFQHDFLDYGSEELMWADTNARANGMQFLRITPDNLMTVTFEKDFGNQRTRHIAFISKLPKQLYNVGGSE